MHTRTCICGRSHSAATATGVHNLVVACHGERRYPAGPRVTPNPLPLLDPSLPVLPPGPDDDEGDRPRQDPSWRPSFLGRRHG